MVNLHGGRGHKGGGGVDRDGGNRGGDRSGDRADGRGGNNHFGCLIPVSSELRICAGIDETLSPAYPAMRMVSLSRKVRATVSWFSQGLS